MATCKPHSFLGPYIPCQTSLDFAHQSFVVANLAKRMAARLWSYSGFLPPLKIRIVYSRPQAQGKYTKYHDDPDLIASLVLPPKCCIDV